MKKLAKKPTPTKQKSFLVVISNENFRSGQDYIYNDVINSYSLEDCKKYIVSKLFEEFDLQHDDVIVIREVIELCKSITFEQLRQEDPEYKEYLRLKDKFDK